MVKKKKQQALPSYDVFISYSHRDKVFAKLLCKALDDQGISYYIDKQNQKGHEELAKELVDAITNSRTLLFVASQNSYDSPFAVKELVYAFNHMPIEHIVVYKVDDSPLPPKIDFVTNSKNVIEAQYGFVKEELIARLCELLQRDVKEAEWGSYENYSWFDSSIGSAVMIALGLLGIGVAVCVGLWQKSLLMGLGTGIGMAGAWITICFSIIFWDDVQRKSKIHRIAYLLSTVICLGGSLMMPVSTWQGLKEQSWGTGLLWAAATWVMAILLIVVLNSAKSGVSIGRAPLTLRKHWERAYDFFLCYNKKDMEMVERIRTELLRNGFTFLESQESSAKQVVDQCRGFLYIASRHSYNDARCDQQLAYGFSHRRPILAYAIDQTGMPKDKKMAFADSNILSLMTHPIETKLMTDLKVILKEYNKGCMTVSSSFWRSMSLSVLYTLAIVIIFVAGYMLGSVALGITIALCVLTAWTTISDASDKRKKYASGESTEVVLLECLLIIAAVALPVLVWWMLNPGIVVSALLVLPMFFIVMSIGEAYEYAAKTSPVGKLSPRQVQQYFDVFISYSRKDTAFADEVCAMLDRHKRSYFIDRQGIPGGSEFPTVLAEAIRNCSMVVFLISKNSAQSKFCQQELSYTFEQKKADERLMFFIEKDDDDLEQLIFNNMNIKNAMEKEMVMGISDDWQERLYFHLSQMIPKTRQALRHEKQQQGNSWAALIKAFTVKSAKSNPITAVTLFVLSLTAIAGFLTHSWVVGLGIYSILEPIFYYLVSGRKKAEDAMTMSGAFITFGVAVGLLTHSVWWGIGAGVAMVILAINRENMEE